MGAVRIEIGALWIGEGAGNRWGQGDGNRERGEKDGMKGWAERRNRRIPTKLRVWWGNKPTEG